MSNDANLRPTFRRHLSHFFWVSVETGGTEKGVADSFFCRDGVCGWVEFKKTNANRVKSLEPEQTAWHAALARKGGRSFFAVRRSKTLHLIAGKDGEVLRNGGLSACQFLGVWVQPWPWAEIERVLLKS